MRTPVKIPKPCFGFEYEDDADCRKCPHRQKCLPAMGRRATRIPLSKATFDFVPPNIDKASDNVEVERPDYVEVYNVCHERVFGKRSTFNSFWGIEDADNRLEEAARDNRCSVITLITCAMYGFQVTNGDRKYYPKFLFGESAKRRVELYREEVTRKFGSLDGDNLEDLLYGERSGDTERKLLDSEIIAGNWIVGYKIKHGGDPFPIFLEQNEFLLSPLWLAIEPEYEEIFQEHLVKPTGTDSIKRHRHSVSLVLRSLKKSGRKKWSRARYLFQSREKIMQKAIATVLGNRRFKADDFEVENAPITDAVRMWSRLGLAIQHFQCLKMTEERRFTE